MPRLSQEIPGPPTCAFCGAVDSDRYVGGYGNHICRECIVDPQLAEPLPPAAICALCQAEVGSPGGGLRPVVAVQCRNGAVLCDECQRLAEEILTRDSPGSPPIR